VGWVVGIRAELRQSLTRPTLATLAPAAPARIPPPPLLLLQLLWRPRCVTAADMDQRPAGRGGACVGACVQW
jgi:hypothetical protein